jgi:1-acyl-sn-glycerol-3-phosphate acyltransferase
MWPKRGLLRHPGTVVIEYLPRMPKDLKPDAFTKELEERIEPASDALMKEAGFIFKDRK